MGTISVSMIVKNEESCLATALESVKGADEIVICDTGSIDRTIEIARQYTDKVFTDYVWSDNFAEARNHAADKCTMDYILIIDADEKLQDGAIEAFKKFDGEALSIQAKCASTGQVHSSIRLHRNTKDIRWQGAIHNYLNCQSSHATGWQVIYGYSKSHEYDPDRTLRILKKQVRQNPGSPREQYYLGIEYVNKQMYDKALYWLKRYVKTSNFLPEKADAYIMITRILWRKNQTEAAKRACMEALLINPDSWEALDLMSRITGAKARLKWQRYRDLAENTGALFNREDKRITVTMLCEEDFAGSGYRMVQAVREAEPAKIDIEQIVMRYGQLGHKSGLTVQDIGEKTVQDRINRSDIIHFKGDFAYNGSWNGFKLPEHAKRIYSVGGSFFRRNGDKLISYGDTDLRDYVADYKTALTPDLIYEDDWHWTPHPWLNFQYTWERKKLFKVFHIPSDPLKKGTDLVVAAMDIVLAKRNDITFICMSDLTPQDSEAVKAYAHLYLDQFRADAYGNASIEAMQYGVPVVTWLGDYYPENVVQSPKELTAESLAECVDALLDWDKLEELSKRTFDYVQRVHGRVGVHWVNKYRELYEAAAK